MAQHGFRTKGPPLPQTLTAQEQKFCEELAVNGANVKGALLAAGYPESTLLTATRWVRARREHSNRPKMWDFYMELREKMLSHLDVTEDRILTEYARIAFFDPISMFDDDGSILPLHQMPEDTRRVIAGLDISSGEFMERVIKIKLAEKKGTLDSLARIRGMFKDTVSVNIGFTELLEKITNAAASEPLVTLPGDYTEGEFEPTDTGDDDPLVGLNELEPVNEPVNEPVFNPEELDFL